MFNMFYKFEISSTILRSQKTMSLTVVLLEPILSQQIDGSLISSEELDSHLKSSLHLRDPMSYYN